MYEESENTEGQTGVPPGAGPSKMCVVCSDRALSCNFGAITCESCKAFFRRHAHKEIYGQCDGTCPITVETRSYCRRCRLAKCFTVGMKKELILSDEQKQRRRQKILENRSKRQSQEVFSADSSGIQDMPPRNPSDLSPGSQDTSAHSSITDMETRQDPAPVNWSSGSINTMDTSPKQVLSGSVPKRDIWESFGGQYPQQDTKRPAFDMAMVGGIMSKKELDEGVTMVTSSGEEYTLPTNYVPGLSDTTGATNIPMPPSHAAPMSQPTQGAPVEIIRDPTRAPPETSPVIPPKVIEASGVQMQMKTESMPDLQSLHPALYEPCFFGLHPPSLDSSAFRGLEPEIQHSLLMAIEAYREFCRPLLTIHDKPMPQDYVSLLNRGEECYRQLVRFSKRLPEFRALTQEDQISLLKGNVIEIMIIRFSKCYNLKTNSWMFPHCGDIQSYTSMVDPPVFQGFCVQDYANFVVAALEVSRGDDLILIMLKVITLFWPEIPNVEDRSGIQEAFDKYNRALESYLFVMYPDDTNMFGKIQDVIKMVRDVGKKAHDVMWKSQVADLHPLLKEMFDLR